MSQIETINSSFVYLVLPHVSTNKFGEAKYTTSKDAKSIYSVFPDRFTVEFQINGFNDLVKRYHELIITATKQSEKTDHYKAFLRELDESLYGIFIEADSYKPDVLTELAKKNQENLEKIPKTSIPHTAYGTKVAIKGDYIDKTFVSIKKYNTEINEALIGKVVKPTTVAATVVAAVTDATNAIVTAVSSLVTAAPAPIQQDTASLTRPKAKTKKEKIADFEKMLESHSCDFEPSKWSEQIKAEETKIANYPQEIEKLLKEFKETGDFAKKGRAQRFQKELDAAPGKLVTLKANLIAKQNYYTDGYQPLYYKFYGKEVHDEYSLMEYVNDHATTPDFKGITKVLETLSKNKEFLIHLARNPADRFYLKMLINDRRSSVNRLKKNKDAELRTLELFETDINQIIVPNAETKKYFVKFPEEEPV